ncbi:MAG: phospho-sugar mutase [Flammeovirgaceae bacterium]
MDSTIEAKVNQWLSGNYDAETKEIIRKMDENEKVEAFYKDLEFGTGGLRGIMGVGSNRMNRYTVGTATQGLANYLKQQVKGEIKVVIAHDSRNNSSFFAETCAKVFAANDFTVYLFDSLRPTPELSFAIRHLKCHSGVVITASHNPKEYNGYKAYWADGGQLVPPHDKAVMAEVSKITNINEVKFEGGSGKIIKINKEVDEPYIEMIKSLSISPEAIKAQHDLKIVYTPIHGTGIVLVPEVLKRMGFTNVTVVQEQSEPNGNFPTVIYPNPEEAEALSIGLKKCKELDADILLGTDPDSDRVGIAVKNHKGEFVLLNGNQTAALLFNYIVEVRKQKGLAKPNDFICKTIVTTDLIDAFAKHHGIQCFSVLTGFKYIAELIREYEGKLNFVCGGEESYGYLVGDKVRDKDAIASVAIICEMAAYAKNKGMTLFDMLLEIYSKFGYYKEDLVSLTKKGKSGLEEIKQMMKDLRANPPKKIAGIEVVEIKDYQNSISTEVSTGKTTPIKLPKSDVLQFITKDGSRISARPSGTEPKIKFYFGVRADLKNKADFEQTTEVLNQKIKSIVEDMKLK